MLGQVYVGPHVSLLLQGFLQVVLQSLTHWLAQICFVKMVAKSASSSGRRSGAARTSKGASKNNVKRSSSSSEVGTQSSKSLSDALRVCGSPQGVSNSRQ